METLFRKLRITAIRQETPLAKTFVLEPLDGWIPQYEAGQFLTLVFQTPFGEKRRSYSISSSPALNEPLSITVKRMTNGEFSRLLVDKAQVNDVLLSTGTGGFFRLPPDHEQVQQLFFLAAGSGITPCFSLIKTALALGNFSVTLVYSNRSTTDTIFREQINALGQQYGSRFNCYFLHSDSDNILESRLSSYLLEKLLVQYMKASPAFTWFYLCGPYAYMQAMTITLLISGIPKANIRKEDFDSTPRKVLPVPPDTAAHRVGIHLNGQQHSITVQYPDSITQAARKTGLVLPYSCEAGRCGSCVATCTSGKIWMAYNEVLTDEEVAKGRVLTCQSYPIGGDAELIF